jgi:hypothetical protein
VTSRSNNFRWVLVAVYGAAEDEQKPEFLSELVQYVRMSLSQYLLVVILI